MSTTATLPSADSTPAERPQPRFRFGMNALLMLVVHLAALLGVCLAGWSWRGFVLAVAMYFARMVIVTAGYHRYFAHRAFKTSRVFQFLLAVGAQSAAQRGVLWWASHHRWHHKHSDGEHDAHSPDQRGFFFAHMGWLFSDTWSRTDPNLVPDLYKYPELRWLDRPGFQLLPTAALGLLCLLLGGPSGLLWGFLVSTVMLWHGAFSINSFAHRFGTRRYATGDQSRNHWLLALLTTGEGWHNNHHRYAASARQGFFWWEVDLTYYVLRVLAWFGLVWDLRPVPASVRANTGLPAVTMHCTTPTRG